MGGLLQITLFLLVKHVTRVLTTQLVRLYSLMLTRPITLRIGIQLLRIEIYYFPRWPPKLLLSQLQSLLGLLHLVPYQPIVHIF